MGPKLVHPVIMIIKKIMKNFRLRMCNCDGSKRFWVKDGVSKIQNQ
ncbi:hypothetical protein J627_3139 [Acinetobacter sp. 1245593]|nr:hypothetical protein J627_3139 [Acinetobacter sp. 1245593]